MNKKTNLLLGCVADDFTGASDAASFLVNNGIPTMLFNGIPKSSNNIKDCSAIVIALKTRSVEPDEAVSDTREAFRWLKGQGAEQLYFKYCSTFDSTKKGNIGPVIDGVFDDMGFCYTLLCPSLPVNKRIVQNGRLIVDGIPLDEGHMKNHPLNPMWDSHLDNLMKPQGKYECLILDKAEMSRTRDEILEQVKMFFEGKEHFYVVPEYTDANEGRKITEVFGDIEFITGGSGLLAHLAEKYIANGNIPKGINLPTEETGKGIVLSGSCSKATKGQIENFLENGGKALAIDAFDLINGSMDADSIWRFVLDNNDSEVLLYSSGALREGEAPVAANHENEAHILEKTIAEIGKRAYGNGYSRIIVAGGETSGAVTLALGFDSFHIGESVAPGVPVMIPATDRNARIVLKSGNFGQPDFFKRALDATRS